MRDKSRITFLLMIAAAVGLTAGCHKKVAVAPPPPPPTVEEKIAPPAPNAPTASLIAEPSTIMPGQAITLKWSSTDATDVRISGVGTVSVEGAQEIRPTESTMYELVATGPGGSAKALATVSIMVPPPPIVSVALDPPSLQDRMAELSDAYFDYDQSKLREDTHTILAKDAEALRSILTDFPNAVIVLEGHCDERGSAEYNLGLGEQRAAAAREYLAALGISADRLKTVSYGKERPQCTESTEGCWRMNRRVHFAAGTTATN
jgi:peptidoglycan-associated lipoprotein